MRFFEKGTGDKVILILHPILANHKCAVELSRYLGAECRFIIPDLSGHGAEIENDFISASDEADKIETYLKAEGIDKLEMIIGLSMGCLVAIELYSRNTDRVNKVVLEGAPLYRYGALFTAVATKMYLNMQKKTISDRSAIESEFSKSFGKEIGKEMAEDFPKMSNATIKNCAKTCAKFSFPKIEKTAQKKMFFRYGGKDSNYKAGVKRTWKYYPDAELIKEEGFDHCEFPLKQPKEFVASII